MGQVEAFNGFISLILMYSMNTGFPVGEISSIFTLLLCNQRLRINECRKRKEMDGTDCSVSLFDTSISDYSSLPPELLHIIIYNHFKSPRNLALLFKYLEIIQHNSVEIIKYSLFSLNKYGYCSELKTALRQFYRPEDDNTETLIPYNKEWFHFIKDRKDLKMRVVQCLKEFGLDSPEKFFVRFDVMVMIHCSKVCGVRDTGYYFDLPCEYCSSLCKTPICWFYDKPCENCKKCNKAEEVRMRCGNDDDD